MALRTIDNSLLFTQTGAPAQRGDGSVLINLLVAGQAVSAVNPVASLVERVPGAISASDAIALIGAQLLGGVLGAAAANMMYGRSAVSRSAHQRGGAMVRAEVTATLGLLLIIFRTAFWPLRSGGFAVGGLAAHPRPVGSPVVWLCLSARSAGSVRAPDLGPKRGVDRPSPRMGSAWRCSSRHRPSSRRYMLVTRSATDRTSSPPATLASNRSISSVYPDVCDQRVPR